MNRRKFLKEKIRSMLRRGVNAIIKLEREQAIEDRKRKNFFHGAHWTDKQLEKMKKC